MAEYVCKSKIVAFFEYQKLDSSAFALFFTEISVVWITEIYVAWVTEISVASLQKFL